MSTLTAGRVATPSPRSDDRRAVRDSLVVTLGGQVEQVVGTFTSLFLRSRVAIGWGLDVAHMGVYTSARVLLDYANWSSLGTGLGAVQEIPILRAAGRETEAKRVADVAYTAATVLCLIYAAGLLVVASTVNRWTGRDPLATTWASSLVAVAVLAILHRYQSLLIAVLRAHQEFVLTTELAVIDATLQAVFTVACLGLAGFWGLWLVVGLLYLFNVAYLHARNPFRFGWVWDAGTTWRLMRTGLPILVNTVAFGVVLHLDKPLILRYVPDGAEALGLYTIALMGTGWGLDLSGRVAVVMYTYYQTTLGRTDDPSAVARQAARTTESLAPILALGGSVAFLIGPDFLGWALPRYAGGLVALRPLLPGTVLLGLAWPARQMLIAIGHPYRLALATLAGLAVAAAAGAIGATQAGLAGVAGGMSVGYAAVSLFTSGVAFLPGLGLGGWLGHLGRVSAWLAFAAVGTWVASVASSAAGPGWVGLVVRGGTVAAWGSPTLWIWGTLHGWGGLFDRWPGRASR